MLVYQARLDEAVQAVVSVAVRTRPAAAGLGTGRLRTACRVTVRYAAADGSIRRHRGQIMADLPPGVCMKVAACQVDGGEVLLTLRPVRGAPAQGAALTDRFTLPIGLQAWGVTAVSAAEAAVRLRCRAREQELVLRGVVRLRLETPGGPFYLRIPFLRTLAVDVPGGLRWQVCGGVTGLHVGVAPGGKITGELVMAVRCEGRPGVSSQDSARPPFAVLREVTGKIARVEAEPAGPGHSVVRGAVELDLYGTGADGCSRWTGRTVPFSALVAVAGERLEAHARIERLSHGPAGIQIALAVGVTALSAERVQLGPEPYRLERITGSASATVVLSEALVPDQPAVDVNAERRESFLPIPGPGDGWAELAVVLSTPRVQTARGAGRWNVRAALGGTPAGEPPYPAPLRAATGGTAHLAGGEALAVAPCLVRADAGGLRLRTALVRGPALPLLEGAPAGAAVSGYLPLPGPTRAVAGLSLSAAGDVAALVATDRSFLLRGTVAGLVARPVAATAFPVLQDGRWQLCVLVTQAKDDAGQ